MIDNIEIIITGDFVPPSISSKLEDSALQSFLYERELLDTISHSDLSITNLEVPLTNANKPIKKSGPSMFGSPENIRFIKLGGFNMVTLANNHIMDYDGKGLNDTIKLCERNHIATVGAGVSEKEAKETYYIDIKGKKIAIINTAENEFLFSKTSTFQAHNFDLIDIFQKIVEAKSKADFVLLIYHGGVENFQLPYPKMRKNLKFLSSAGVSAIVCHHTHCYSGYEVYNEVPIFYGLGNFVFDRKANIKTWFEGFILKLKIDNNLKLDFELIPYSQSLNNTGVRLMKTNDFDNFHKSINKLNKILSNSKAYEKHWDILIKKITPKLIKHIYPPSFLSNEKNNLNKHKGTKKIVYLYNLIRTESTHFCLLEALDEIYQ